jgi:ribonucleoside-triphosphate reductase
MLYIVKRDGSSVPFDKKKIVDAINKAFIEVDGTLYEDDTANDIADEIKYAIKTSSTNVTVETIQDWVENYLMRSERKDVARAYIRYRYDKEKERELKQELYGKFNALITGKDEESKKEKSNKDTRIIPTMRDYIAGFSCRDMAKSYFPKEIWEAHENGLIHIHDTDYSPAMPMYNCSLINLEDMLSNGTVISKTKIESPKSFRTCCTVVTQIITQVASCQYGGNTINLAHLAPYVDISRQKIRKQVEEELDFIEYPVSPENLINEIAEKRVLEEIKDGIQTIQYQLITMSTTNG